MANFQADYVLAYVIHELWRATATSLFFYYCDYIGAGTDYEYGQGTKDYAEVGDGVGGDGNEGEGAVGDISGTVDGGIRG